MSDGKISASAPAAKGKALVPQLRDTAILLGWIAGLILIAALCWALTQPVRSRFLLKAANKVLEETGSSYSLGEPVPPSAFSAPHTGMAGALIFSTWYTVTDSGNSGREQLQPGAKAIVFTFVSGGTFFPCMAVVTGEGKVQEFIPLTSYGERIMKRLPAGILRIYTSRIEGAHS